MFYSCLFNFTLYVDSINVIYIITWKRTGAALDVVYYTITLLCLMCNAQTYCLCTYYGKIAVKYLHFYGMCGMCYVPYTIQSFLISRTHNL